MRKSSGMSFIEVLISLFIISIIFLPLVDVLSKAYSAEYKNRLNTNAKETIEIAMNNMSSKLEEASYLYTSSVTIPTITGTAVADPASNAVVALLPLFNSNGDASYSGGYATYFGLAYTLLPASTYDSTDNTNNYVLVQTYKYVYCQTSTDQVTPSGSCTTDWVTGGNTYLIFKNAKPGSFSNYGYTSPIVNLGSTDGSKNYEVKMAFGYKEGYVYFPSSSGTSISSNNMRSSDIFCRNVRL